MIRKSQIAYVAIVVILLVAFNGINIGPLARFNSILQLLLGLTGFAVLITNYSKFSSVLRKLAIFLGILLFASVAAAYFTQNQSIVSSTRANVGIFISGIGFLVYYLMLKYDVPLKKLERPLTTMAWILALYLIYYHYSPSKYVDEIKNQVIDIDSMRQELVILGSFLYLAKYFRTEKIKFLIFSLMLLVPTQLVEVQRGFLLLFATVFIFALIRNRNRIVTFSIVVVAFVLIPLSIILVPQTKFGENLNEKFSSALEIFDNHKRTYRESSIQIRVEEIQYANKSIREYPIFGIGRRGSESKKELLSDFHFYESDIGLIGILYAHGWFGIILFIYLLVFVYKYVIQTGPFDLPFAGGYKLNLLYICLLSVLSGAIILYPFIYVVLTSLIQAGYRLNSGESE